GQGRRGRSPALLGALVGLRGARAAAGASPSGRPARGAGGIVTAGVDGPAWALDGPAWVVVAPAWALVALTGAVLVGLPSALVHALGAETVTQTGQVGQPGGDLGPLTLDVSVRGLTASPTPLALVGTSTSHGATVRRTATLVVPASAATGAGGAAGISSMGDRKSVA